MKQPEVFVVVCREEGRLWVDLISTEGSINQAALAQGATELSAWRVAHRRLLKLAKAVDVEINKLGGRTNA